MKHGEVVLHGECMVTPISAVPAGATRVERKGPFQIVAPSETTGNHHVVDLNDGVQFYQSGDKLYMEASVDTAIRCVIEARHTEIPLPAGTYEFGSQQEYDPFTARLAAVRD